MKCLRAAGCGERVFVLVMLIFYLHENEIHVLTLQEPSCGVEESISIELYTADGGGVGAD